MREMSGILGIGFFREWLALFAVEAVGSVGKSSYSFALSDGCMTSLREAVYDELYEIARYVLDTEAANTLAENQSILPFVKRLREKGKAAFDENEPLLRPALERRAEELCLSVTEMLERTDRHRSEIAERLLDRKDFTRLEQIVRRGHTDYASGRIVTELVTDAGSFLYKPRDLRPDVWFGRLCARMIGSFVQIPETLCCGEVYGFTGYIRSEPVDSLPAGPETAYAFGAFCTLAYVCGVSDLHKKNVWVSGGGLCPIDLELLFRPNRKGYVLFRLADEFPEFVSADEEAFFCGIADAYRRCIDGRDELKAAVDTAREFWIRVASRDGKDYTERIQKFRHPRSLRSAEEENVCAEKLRAELQQKSSKGKRALVDFEVEQLRRGCIPVFTARAGGTDLFCNGESAIEGYFSQSQAEGTKEFIDALSEEESETLCVDLKEHLRKPKENE